MSYSWYRDTLSPLLVASRENTGFWANTHIFMIKKCHMCWWFVWSGAVNPCFYVVFKIRELTPIEWILFQMSSPEWELGQISVPCNPGSFVWDKTFTTVAHTIHFLNTLAGTWRIWLLFPVCSSRYWSTVALSCDRMWEAANDRVKTPTRWRWTIRSSESWSFGIGFKSSKDREHGLETYESLFEGVCKDRDVENPSAYSTGPFNLQYRWLDSLDGFGVRNEGGELSAQ